MSTEVLMHLKGSVLLTNSWKQAIDITENGVRGEVINGLKRTKMTLPYDRIAQVNLHRGVLTATIEIINKGGAGNLIVKGLDKTEAEKAKALIENRMDLSRQTQNSDTKRDVADELQKLASLKDKGVLSEEEFQAAKSKVLG